MSKKTRRILFFLLPILVCICICFTAVFAIYHLTPNCADKTSNIYGLPTYPFLMSISSTDVTVLGNKQLKPGQTYVIGGDGSWYGNATLLFVNRKGAIFLIEYNDEEKSTFCIWQANKSDFND